MCYEKSKNSVKLLNVLKSMPHRYGPDEFFSLPGRKASVSIYIYIIQILLPMLKEKFFLSLYFCFESILLFNFVYFNFFLKKKLEFWFIYRTNFLFCYIFVFVLFCCIHRPPSCETGTKISKFKKIFSIFFSLISLKSCIFYIEPENSEWPFIFIVIFFC